MPGIQNTLRALGGRGSEYQKLLTIRVAKGKVWPWCRVIQISDPDKLLILELRDEFLDPE